MEEDQAVHVATLRTYVLQSVACLRTAVTSPLSCGARDRFFQQITKAAVRCNGARKAETAVPRCFCASAARCVHGV
jgi:hypothetical protein